MNARKCPICDNELIGRFDKKFCSDQCRYQANNTTKLNNGRQILETNKALRKNRTILKTLCPEGRATVRKEILLNMGYDISVFTSLYVTQQRQVYYLCYEYGFTPITDKGIERALIVHRQSYMNAPDPWKFVKKPS